MKMALSSPRTPGVWHLQVRPPVAHRQERAGRARAPPQQSRVLSAPITTLIFSIIVITGYHVAPPPSPSFPGTPNPPLGSQPPSLRSKPFPHPPSAPPPHPPGNWSPDHFIIRTFFPRLIECEAAAAATALRSPYELLPFLVREASLSRPVTRPAKISISI